MLNPAYREAVLQGTLGRNGTRIIDNNCNKEQQYAQGTTMISQIKKAISDRWRDQTIPPFSMRLDPYAFDWLNSNVRTDIFKASLKTPTNTACQPLFRRANQSCELKAQNPGTVYAFSDGATPLGVEEYKTSGAGVVWCDHNGRNLGEITAVMRKFGRNYAPEVQGVLMATAFPPTIANLKLGLTQHRLHMRSRREKTS